MCHFSRETLNFCTCVVIITFFIYPKIRYILEILLQWIKQRKPPTIDMLSKVYVDSQVGKEK